VSSFHAGLISRMAAESTGRRQWASSPLKNS
jgi:hypothetical protein